MEAPRTRAGRSPVSEGLCDGTTDARRCGAIDDNRPDEERRQRRLYNLAYVITRYMLRMQPPPRHLPGGACG